MKRGKQDLANLIVFCAALAIVMIGVMRSFTHAPTAPRAAPTRRPASAPGPPQTPRVQPPAVQNPRPVQVSAATGELTKGVASAAPKAAAQLPRAASALATKAETAPKRTASAAATTSLPPPQQKRFATRRDAVGRGPVPPLLPPLYGPQMTGVPARPPEVLRLTGVVEGNEKLAIMRRGGKRYMAREGDTVEGQRIVRVSTDSVTLQHGAHKRTLRLSK